MTDKELAIYIGSKIKEFRLQRSLTQKELAALVDMGDTTIANYEKGFRTPKKNTLFKISAALNVTIDDLFPPINKDTSTTLQRIQSVSERLSESRRVIVLDTAQKQLDEQERAEREVSDIIYLYDYYDHPASAGTGQYLTDVAVERIELPVDIDADFVIPIYGDSMEPDYHSGDYIFVKLSVDLSSGDIGVFDYEGDAYVKQLIIEDGQAHLHSLNPTYPDKPITPETNFRIIGEVVGRYGKGEKNGF